MGKLIDLRSDVKTMPTDEMRDAMKSASVGDAVAGEDPTTNKLETIAAELFGKEASLFMPSGTMCNLIALITHARPGEEAIIEEYSHICLSEVGGLAYVGGIMAHPIRGEDGIFSPNHIREAIRPKGLAFSKTGVICWENTHNVYGGKAITPEQMREIYFITKENGIQVHTDGERIFNSAVSQNKSVEELASFTDTITVGLSKGLCAPAGSILIGPSEFISRARKNQKMLGGVPRKPGILAAAGIIALQRMPSRLIEDHENARILAKGLENIGGIMVHPEGVHTNIVNIDISSLSVSPDEFLEETRERGLLLGYHLFKKTLVRLVTYKGITREDVIRSAEIIREVAENSI